MIYWAHTNTHSGKMFTKHYKWRKNINNLLHLYEYQIKQIFRQTSSAVARGTCGHYQLEYLSEMWDTVVIVYLSFCSLFVLFVNTFWRCRHNKCCWFFFFAHLIDRWEVKCKKDCIETKFFSVKSIRLNNLKWVIIIRKYYSLGV